jgi:hypothetical protein
MASLFTLRSIRNILFRKFFNIVPQLIPFLRRRGLELAFGLCQKAFHAFHDPGGTVLLQAKGITKPERQLHGRFRRVVARCCSCWRCSCCCFRRDGRGLTRFGHKPATGITSVVDSSCEQRFFGNRRRSRRHCLCHSTGPRSCHVRQ